MNVDIPGTNVDNATNQRISTLTPGCVYIRSQRYIKYHFDFRSKSCLLWEKTVIYFTSGTNVEMEVSMLPAMNVDTS